MHTSSQELGLELESSGVFLALYLSGCTGPAFTQEWNRLSPKTLHSRLADVLPGLIQTISLNFLKLTRAQN